MPETPIPHHISTRSTESSQSTGHKGIHAIYHHTGLETSGGATRVARLLIEALETRLVQTNFSFELGEGPEAAAILPEDFGRYLPTNAIAHLHCTGNWPALLSSIPPRQKTLITLHDCELFTGGCPYPLDCQVIEKKCANPCPRNFPQSEELREAKRKLIDNHKPILVSPSQWLARLAKKHLSHAVKVIPNGIPWPELPPRKSTARRQLGINPTARVILFVAHGGTSAAYKSGKVWKSLWSRIKARMPEALCFAVGGETAERDGDLVIWPYVGRDRLNCLMEAADLLLYPTQADNHSLVILEAMSRALPVIAYAVGGVPEQVTDRQTGRLITPENEALFIDATVETLTRSSLCRDYGQTAFSSGRKRFTTQRMVTDYLRLYKTLAS
ncbi:glycosyltransferase [Pseudodesulfovibrio piezophilus]|uniref:Glycosyl transferase group 1 n=1 Tax=Pseudodesulfovibrio piezophilus (strain DSM 21447 / JCM 15486 / C1TLV30) TaxID=1322246 RepID=M1WKH6_PSEP2|nr:glycosyltransferase [Pseudodesulfovibrio piezophilus]CCH49616.1 Glycosyl transferase group 1 [Pseudodesulfovibrio piezophilus C1TLV30]